MNPLKSLYTVTFFKTGRELNVVAATFDEAMKKGREHMPEGDEIGKIELLAKIDIE